jgi:hypothetical protein
MSTAAFIVYRLNLNQLVWRCHDTVKLKGTTKIGTEVAHFPQFWHFIWYSPTLNDVGVIPTSQSHYNDNADSRRLRHNKNIRSRIKTSTYLPSLEKRSDNWHCSQEYNATCIVEIVIKRPQYYTEYLKYIEWIEHLLNKQTPVRFHIDCDHIFSI